MEILSERFVQMFSIDEFIQFPAAGRDYLADSSPVSAKDF